jgi:hypothetical protein
MDCFAALAMTAVGGSGLRQSVLRGVIGMAGDIATMEGFVVTGHRRKPRCSDWNFRILRIHTSM